MKNIYIIIYTAETFCFTGIYVTGKNAYTSKKQNKLSGYSWRFMHCVSFCKYSLFQQNFFLGVAIEDTGYVKAM